MRFAVYTWVPKEMIDEWKSNFHTAVIFGIGFQIMRTTQSQILVYREFDTVNEAEEIAERIANEMDESVTIFRMPGYKFMREIYPGE